MLNVKTTTVDAQHQILNDILSIELIVQIVELRSEVPFLTL